MRIEQMCNDDNRRNVQRLNRRLDVGAFFRGSDAVSVAALAAVLPSSAAAFDATTDR